LQTVAESVPAERGKVGASADGGDAADLAAAATGDARAFERLVLRHHARCFRVAARLLNDAAEAEDVTQEAFLKLWTGAQTVRDPQALGGWLARACANLALDRLRRRKPDLPGDLPDVPDASLAPDRNLDRAELSHAVAQAVAALPERQRAALVLVHMEGFGNGEAAAMLGVSVEAVESLLARARRSLKAAFAGTWRGFLDDVSRL
jgi:RNA polymerase sigma-70 factor, ECF subfamily